MSESDDLVLQVSDLEVRLDNEVILSGISFDLRQGEVLTILGPNGAGKTVLLRALMGGLEYKGRIIWKKDKHIAYVPQRLPYIKNIPLSVSEFFSLKKHIAFEVGSLLRQVGLESDAANKQIGEFSSGQFQRILIAWALADEPEVLLFDEPTAGIDIGGEETVYSLLTKLHHERDLTMLIVTHDLAMVHRLSSMVLCLNKQIVCMGPPLETLTSENLKQLFGSDMTIYKHDHE